VVEICSGDEWWSHVEVTWWSHVVKSCGGVTWWWWHAVESSGGDTWWRHVVKSCGGVTWWCHVVESRGEVTINNKVLFLSMFCYNMKVIPSIIAKLQPVTAKTMKISII
jgi:hypothetical protein